MTPELPMSLYRVPDWQDALCTGTWQISYRLDDGRMLMFWGGAPDAPSRADREWGVVVMSGRVRDLAGEQSLLANPAFARQVRTCVIDGGTFLVTMEGQIDTVVDAARADFAGPPEERVTA